MTDTDSTCEPGTEALRGQQSATILFADISGFTALSGKMNPEDLADTMNACFELIERVIVERDGSVEQYIGDAAMALFTGDDAAAQALNAALAIRAAMGRLNEDRELPAHLDVHFGVHSGSVPAASDRSGTKRDYAGLWSVANVASGLQGAASDGQIYASAATYVEVGELSTAVEEWAIGPAENCTTAGMGGWPLDSGGDDLLGYRLTTSVQPPAAAGGSAWRCLL